MPTYAEEVTRYERIIALYPSVEAARARLRPLRPVHPVLRARAGARARVNADRALNAIADKAASTHAAIKLLLDQDHPDAAAALARVLLENVLLMEWLMADPFFRLDLYCLSTDVPTRAFALAVPRHYAKRPEVIAAAARYLASERGQMAAEVFEKGSPSQWARRLGPDRQSMELVTLADMARELAASEGKAHSVAYDVTYARLSGHVHSTAAVTSAFGQQDRECLWFSLSPESVGPPLAEILRDANTFMRAVLILLDDYVGLGLRAQIDETAT